MEPAAKNGDEDIEPDDPLEGTVCELRQYDSVFNSKGERILLQMGARKRHRTSQRNDSSRRSALVLTKFWDRRRDSCRVELDIQSHHMKKALKKCIPEYAELDIEHKPIIIVDEPRCVFHYRRELIQYRQLCMQNRKLNAGQHVQYLIDYMASHMLSEIHIFNSMVDTPTQPPAIDFLNLWMVFVPGDLICVGGNVHRRTMNFESIVRFKSMSRCRCTKASCDEFSWTITTQHINFNGTDFGHEPCEFRVDSFDGFQALADMRVSPLKYHPNREAITQEAVARGKKYRDLITGYHHMSYQGVARLRRDFSLISKPPGLAPSSVSVNGRIMIDSVAFYKALPLYEPEFDLGAKIFRTGLDQHGDMTDDELMICDDELVGFSLNDMQWGFFKVDLVKEVQYDNDAFNSLIFDQDYKDMILSLVKVHTDELAQCDDIITGKGKGMIFLLHGEPGVGKTLTAESVADYTKKPLFRLQVSMLRSDTNNIEETLFKACELATKWNAVALLDEADVFLEQRDSTNLQRNFLVSTFLRVSEYYQGILFLTTNRITSFDRAFKSRIHLAIHYPALDGPSRQQLWELFVSRLPNNAGASLIESGDLKFLDDNGLNGRQIKNMVRTAHSLFISKGEAVFGLHDIQRALKTLKFTMSIGHSEDTVASDSEAIRGVKRRRID